jgi:hypothetical protein
MSVTRDRPPAILSSAVRKAERRRNVLAELTAPCQFGFAVERAVFLTVPSDRAAEKWRADYWIEGSDALRLHDLYRAMAWLGEPLGEAAPEALAPRCVMDLVDEDCSPAAATCLAN